MQESKRRVIKKRQKRTGMRGTFEILKKYNYDIEVFFKRYNKPVVIGRK